MKCTALDVKQARGIDYSGLTCLLGLPSGQRRTTTSAASDGEDMMRAPDGAYADSVLKPHIVFHIEDLVYVSRSFWRENTDTGICVESHEKLLVVHDTCTYSIEKLVRENPTDTETYMRPGREVVLSSYHVCVSKVLLES